MHSQPGARSFLSSTTLVPLVTGCMWTNPSSSKNKSLQFPIPEAHGNGNTGPGVGVAASLSPALGRENSSLSLCLCGRRRQPWDQGAQAPALGESGFKSSGERLPEYLSLLFYSFKRFRCLGNSRERQEQQPLWM